MTRTDGQVAEANRKLDEVESHGPEFAVRWLRGAFLTHEEQVAHLLSSRDELRQLFLGRVAGPLTVREAQLLSVCRVCRGKVSAPFALRYGDEHAHESCLKATP